ncbi:hypothetical protein ACA910_020674 [Epithemia clementina (nom. ined.)]
MWSCSTPASQAAPARPFFMKGLLMRPAVLSNVSFFTQNKPLVVALAQAGSSRGCCIGTLLLVVVVQELCVDWSWYLIIKPP